MIVCPKCNKHYYTGKLTGTKKKNQKYFCRECFIEFSFKNDKTMIYKISPNGTLKLIEEIAI